MRYVKRSRVVGLWSDGPIAEDPTIGVDQSGLRTRPEPELARGAAEGSGQSLPSEQGVLEDPTQREPTGREPTGREPTGEVSLDELREVEPAVRPSVPPPLPASLELPMPEDEAAARPDSAPERVDFDELARRTAAPPPPAWRVQLRWLWRMVGLPAAAAALAGILLAAGAVAWVAPRLVRAPAAAPPEAAPIHVVRLPLIRLGPGPAERALLDEGGVAESDMVFDLDEVGPASE